MTPEELKEDIHIVFEKELNDILNYWNQYVLSHKEGKNEAKFEYNNSDVLINIFSNIQNNEDLKQLFIDEIFDVVDIYSSDYLINDLYISVLSPLPLWFYTFLQLWYIDFAIDLYSNKTSPISIIPILSDVLQLNQDYFTNHQLWQILKILSNIRYNSGNHKWHHDNTSRKQRDLTTFIINKRYNNVQQKIKWVNLEINNDRKEVSSIIRYLDFDDRYNILLTDIDWYINSKASDATSAAMIWNLRSFLSDLILDLAKRVSKDVNEDIPHIENHWEIWDARLYLKDKFELHDNDDRLINSLVNVLHEQWWHSFISSKKYFRLTRNMVIEIVLFLLSKYNEFNDKKVNK